MRMASRPCDDSRSNRTLSQLKACTSVLFCAFSLSGCLFFDFGGSSGSDESSNDFTETTEVTDQSNQSVIDPTNTNSTTDVAFGYRTPVGVTSCSVEDINMRVDFDMRDYYIYYDQVPQLNLADYDTPENLIRDLRVDPDTFSFVTDAATQNALVTTGATGGFGFLFRRASDGVVRAKEVLFGSPADDAGLLRGDELVLVNGIPTDDLTSEQIDTAYDPDNAPVNLTVRTGDEPSRDISVDFADYKWRTAGPAFKEVEDGFATIGYLPIRRFLESTRAEINRSVEFLRSGVGIDELVVDLRYNTGGRISVANQIAALVGGVAVEDEAFLLISSNDKYAENNETLTFEAVDEPLNLSRVFVLTTERTASSSEIFINSLEPYIDVVVIGDVTVGKPFLSISQEYCGKSINAMREIQTNSVGVSVAGGIQPDCRVQDGWETTADNLDDPLFGAAVSIIDESVCPTDIQANLRTLPRDDLGVLYRDPELFVPER